MSKVYDLYFLCENTNVLTNVVHETNEHQVVYAGNETEAILELLQYLWKWNNNSKIYGSYIIPLDIRCEEN